MRKSFPELLLGSFGRSEDADAARYAQLAVVRRSDRHLTDRAFVRKNGMHGSTGREETSIRRQLLCEARRLSLAQPALIDHNLTNRRESRQRSTTSESPKES